MINRNLYIETNSREEVKHVLKVLSDAGETVGDGFMDGDHGVGVRFQDRVTSWCPTSLSFGCWQWCENKDLQAISYKEFLKMHKNPTIDRNWSVETGTAEKTTEVLAELVKAGEPVIKARTRNHWRRIVFKSSLAKWEFTDHGYTDRTRITHADFMRRMEPADNGINRNWAIRTGTVEKTDHVLSVLEDAGELLLFRSADQDWEYVIFISGLSEAWDGSWGIPEGREEISYEEFLKKMQQPAVPQEPECPCTFAEMWNGHRTSCAWHKPARDAHIEYAIKPEEPLTPESFMTLADQGGEM